MCSNMWVGSAISSVLWPEVEPRGDLPQVPRTQRSLGAFYTPSVAASFMAAWALIITIPALFGNADGFPVAFFAVVSIAVIGLYIAYAIPIYLRWRHGDRFDVGPWNNGKKYRWMNPFAVFWTALITIIFILPTTPAGVPWNDEFTLSSVNYAPIAVGVVIAAVGIWWLVSAKDTFTGPRHTVAEVDAELGESHADTPSGTGA